MKISKLWLNKRTYPLYVGGSPAEGFRDWDGKGSSVLLEARVISDRYQGADITWNVGQDSIAYFEDSGLAETDNVSRRRVRARRTGITEVTATLPDGTSTRCVITVIDHISRMTVSEIVLNTKALHLVPGRTASLIPILYPKDLYGNGILDTALLWESKDDKIALVENGIVKAVAEGETDILVSSADVGRNAVCHICVSGSGTLGKGQAEVYSSVPQELKVGDSLQLSKPEGMGEVIWQSENRYAADVDEKGVVTAYSRHVRRQVDESGLNVTEVAEPVWIYATEMEGGIVCKYPVWIREEELPIWQIAMNPTELALPIGECRYMTAAILPSVSRKPPMAWMSSDETVVSVSATEDTIYGVSQAQITAKRSGEAVVTVVCGGVKSECKIQVTARAVKVADIRIPKKIELSVDQVWQFEPEMPESVFCKKLHWLCDDFNVATVDNEGNVQGYRAGYCRIYAVADDSLSVQKRDELEEWKERREFARDAAALGQFLDGLVYAKCSVQVEDASPCLRNLHVVEEAVTDHSVLLLWNRASLPDVGDFDKYLVYCGGQLVSETRKLGYQMAGLMPGTDYHFEVKAVNWEGKILASAQNDVATSEASGVINVLDFGARGDGKHMDTRMIQRAIDECPVGGTVLLPEGHAFVSGALFLKSHMTFQVDGILLGSSNPKDYPRVITRWEGWRKLEQSAEDWANTTPKVPVNHCPHASLLNAGCYEEGESGSTGPFNVENLVICGKGQINANGFSLAYNEGPNGNAAKLVSKEYPMKDATSRGSAIRIHNGRNIYVKDVQVAYAPGWTIHTIYCSHITFDGMELVSQGDGDCGFGTSVLHRGHVYNGDGIDPDSCVHVNIFDCFFTTGDDAVAIKSGRNQEGSELDKPSAYIRVTDSTSSWSLGGIGTGSESSGGSHDMLFQNLRIDHVLVSGIWIKTNIDRGGVVEYIQVRDVYVDACESPVWILNNYSSTSVVANPSKKLAKVRNLIFENVHGGSGNKMGFRLTGIPEIPIQNVRFRNISAGGKENRMKYCEDISGLE